MSTVAQQRPSNALVAKPVAPPDLSMEHRFRRRGRAEDEWGQSESLDPENVGDIADEGLGHRG